MALTQITTDLITDNAVTAGKIATGAVTADKLAAGAAGFPRGHIAGLTVSNNGTTPTTDLDFAAGTCRDRAYSWAFATDTGSSLTSTFVAYWKLDEATGIRKDSYGWYDFVPLRNGPTSAAGKSGAAASFASASSQHLLQIPNTNLLTSGDHSFAGWVYVTSLTGDAQYFVQTRGATAYENIRYQQSSARFEYTYTDTAGNIQTAVANTFGAPSTGTWYFIVCKYLASSKVGSISVNNGAFDSGSALPNALSTDNVLMGLGANLNTSTFNPDATLNGRMDEWGLWHKTLSSQEITDLYASGNGQTLTETISDSANLTCAAQTAKRLSSAWSAGSSGGLLDTGSIAASKTYHLFAIQKADGTQDYVASLNPKKPTLPSGYLYYRRIRSVRTNGSSQVVAETQVGHAVYYPDNALDVNVTNPGALAVARTLSSPTGIVTDVFISVFHAMSTGNSTRISSLNQNDEAVSGNNATTASVVASSQLGVGLLRTQLTRSGQLRSRLNSSGAGDEFRIATVGYSDPDILGAGR